MGNLMLKKGTVCGLKDSLFNTRVTGVGGEMRGTTLTQKHTGVTSG